MFSLVRVDDGGVANDDGGATESGETGQTDKWSSRRVRFRVRDDREKERTVPKV